MLGLGTTAGKIDDFESRFTIVNGAHFLIAGGGREAWPITAAEADAFKARYRRRMIRARWFRRISLAAPILLVLFGDVFRGWPEPVLAVVRVVATLAILNAITLGFQLHIAVSYVTKFEIERELKRRITTIMPEAVTPNLTALGRFARRLLLILVVLEIGLTMAFMAVGPSRLADILGVTGSGYQAWLVHLAAALLSLIKPAILLAFLLLVIDRYNRRSAATPPAGAPGPSEPH